MIKRVLNAKTKTIISAAFVLAFASLMSRFLGLFRDHMLARTFGAGNTLDVYYAAFRIPDLIYAILITGVLGAAFIPVFTEYLHKNKKEAWQMMNAFLNLMILASIGVALILIIFTPQLISLIAPGFAADKQALTVNLTRIMFLSPILLGVSSIFSSVLQSFKNFMMYALAPILYNIGIIIGVIFFVPIWGIYGLAYGVVLGAFLHMIIQLPTVIYYGFRWRPLIDTKHGGTRKIVKMMVPKVVSLTANQINLLVITAIASTLAIGSVAIFNLANNLQWIIIGIIGVSFSVAAFPTLSDDSAKKDMKKFQTNFAATFRQILFLAVPLSVLFFLLRAQIVRVVLGAGAFGWRDTQMTAACLGIFSFGVFAYTLAPLISKSFYALYDTKTPAIINTSAIILNVILSFYFVYLFKTSFWFGKIFTKFLSLENISRLDILGLPLAFIVAGLLNLIILILVFSKKTKFFRGSEIWHSFLRIALASLFMAGIVYNIIYYMGTAVDMQTFAGVFTQGLVAGVSGIIIYLVLCYALGSREIRTLVKLLKSKLGG